LWNARITQYKVLSDSMLWLQEVASHRDVFVYHLC